MKNRTRELIDAENRSPRGRKKIKVSFEKIEREVNIPQVLYWIGMQATAEEIAGSFRVSVATLDLRLREHFGMNFTDLKKSLGDGAEGKLALRRYQFRQAETNTSMAIWLGKQWLGQKDTIQQDMNINQLGKVNVYIPDNQREINEEKENSVGI